jgi:hypothetical protein
LTTEHSLTVSDTVKVSPSSPVAVPVPAGAAGEAVRAVALARVHQLYSDDQLTLERFSWIVEQLLRARDDADLERAMRTLPPIVRLTPRSRRLERPLVLRVPDADLRLGPGWQLAARTTVVTGCGRARLDLAAASWDEESIELHLETWGSIEVLVPRGVAVQIAGGQGGVRHDALSPALPGGPRLRVSRSGPTGVIHMRHPGRRGRGPLGRFRERRVAGRRGSRGLTVAYDEEERNR